ncbi:MAG: GGDEF domain-containing protein [Lachnospiraceae bacterium]|nr:GGDEF domain-containing protein [Lachnospiraceae bacterium]
MARKRIGLFMSEITQFFQFYCGKALSRLIHERDMDLIVYASFGSYSSPYGRNLLSEIGKKNIIYLPDYKALDAIIVLPNSFDIPGMDTEFLELVKEKADCPVICLQNDYSDRYPEFYSITIENLDSMYAMTRHIIEHHKCTDICYMSGPFTSKDSPDRLKGFQLAMAEAGLNVGPNSVYEGNYWTNRGKKAIDLFMQDRDTYPQAIICANDFMALSICDELKKRGRKIPEEICVTGFDGIWEGQQNDPPLTTVTIRPQSYADAAMKLLDDLFAGKERNHLIHLFDEIDLRKSCGCGMGRKRQDFDHSDHIRKMLEQENLLREAGRITGDYQNRYDIGNSLSVADYYFSTLGCEKGYLCLCDDDDPAMIQIEENEIFSDEMTLIQVMRASEMMNPQIVNEKFRTSQILPHKYFETDKPGTYIIYPLNYKNKEYGYLILCPQEGQWPTSLTNTYTNSLSTALENNFYQSRYKEFADAKRLSETDPLTGLYNRRGFEKGLSGLLLEKGNEEVQQTHIGIVSIDMDNLKGINDEYGHAEGDFALRTLADILRSCIRENEICARFGGDEFSVILITKEADRIGSFTKEFDALLEQASKDSGKPYPIHASIGISALEGRDTKDIFECMQSADQHMYANKREYKGNKPQGREGF